MSAKAVIDICHLAHEQVIGSGSEHDNADYLLHGLSR